MPNPVFFRSNLTESHHSLTTSNTRRGRKQWLRLPFGIKYALEIYQRIMDEMLKGIDGAYAIIDDILKAGDDQKHHDEILKKVVSRATEYNLKLNFDKCKIRQKCVRYMGHVSTDKGIVQYLSQFIPNLSQVDAPLRVLLKSDVKFESNHEQEQSFSKLKKLICSNPPVLAFYDVHEDVEIERDASEDGLGAVLLQSRKVVVDSSRALTEAEKRYARLEKEMLSMVYSVSKFHCYVFGKKLSVYNDHNHLEQILKKPLIQAPMRLQKMMMRLQ